MTLAMTMLGWNFFLLKWSNWASNGCCGRSTASQRLVPAWTLFREGPVMLIANHSAWVDPFWIGKVFNR